MPFLLAEILNFQGSTHHIGVGSFSYLYFTGILSKTRKNHDKIRTKQDTEYCQEVSRWRQIDSENGHIFILFTKLPGKNVKKSQ